MGIIPEDWLDDGKMKRIICHWSAGGHKASDLDRSHYHILIEDDGELVRGFHSIKANESAADGSYAAHTRGTNSGSIGIAVCCMAGAQESPFKPGKAPMTRKQWQVMAEVVAELCHAYSIPITPTTVLAHGEVERNLGKKQNGKWDPLVLPWDTSLSRREVGDAFRALVAESLEGPADPEPSSKVKTMLNNVEISDAVSANEDTFIKVSELLRALNWQLVGAEIKTAAFKKADDESLFYLPHALLGDQQIDESEADDAVTAVVSKDGYVSVTELARLLNLVVSFDVATGVLDVRAAAPPAGPADVKPPPRQVVIKSGDTLSRIAERYLGSQNKWRLLRKQDGTPFTEVQARKLKLGDVVLLPDAEPMGPAVSAVQPVAGPAGAAAPAGLADVDLDDLVNAAAADVRSSARQSIPVILAECKAQGVTDPAQIAYVLATSEHESKCGRFMRELWGPTPDQARYEGRADLKNTVKGDGFRYRGRGFVQVTGRGNYTTWRDILGIDIVSDPDQVAKDPRIAAKILVGGMRDGKFRPGHSLAAYTNGENFDFFNAREIINADKKRVDKGHSASRGSRIAEIAARYYAVLGKDSPS